MAPKPGAKDAPADDEDDLLLGADDEVIDGGDDGDDGGADEPDEHADESEENDPDNSEGADEVADVAARGGDDDDAPTRGRGGREERRIQALLTRDKENKARTDKLERELQELRAAQQQERVDPRAEAERLALMSTDERVEYRLAQAERTNNIRTANLQMQLADATDRAEFAGKVAADPLYAKYKDKVETELASIRAKGQNIGREQLFKYLVGEAAIAARGKGNRQQRRAAESRVRRAQAAPAGGRGDTASSDRRGSNNTPAKRLEGVNI